MCKNNTHISNEYSSIVLDFQNFAFFKVLATN